jgi:hypothetical protein
VSAGAIRNRLGAGAQAYREIVRQIPAVTGPTIFKAIHWGIERKLFREEAYADSLGKRRKRLIVGRALTPVQLCDEPEGVLTGGVSP